MLQSSRKVRLLYPYLLSKTDFWVTVLTFPLLHWGFSFQKTETFGFINSIERKVDELMAGKQEEGMQLTSSGSLVPAEPVSIHSISHSWPEQLQHLIYAQSWRAWILSEWWINTTFVILCNLATPIWFSVTAKIWSHFSSSAHGTAYCR